MPAANKTPHKSRGGAPRDTERKADAIRRTLKELRDELRRGMYEDGVTQAELARRLGTSTSDISQFFNKNRVNNLYTLDTYARAAGYKVVIKIEKRKRRWGCLDSESREP